MSELIVMRHGQASFLSGHYDQLSELGHDQARRLGTYWAARGLAPTRVVVGPRKRHRQSAEALLAGLAGGGLACPDPVYEDRLDEFDWDGLFRYANSTLSSRDAHVGALKLAFEGAQNMAEKRRTIQHYMEAVTSQWAAGAFFEEGLESWSEFRGRVEVARILYSRGVPRGSRVVFVTSGGVAAAIVGQVLGLDAERTLGLIWTLRNGALVEFLFHGERMSLSSFNNAPHLPDKELWTYR